MTSQVNGCLMGDCMEVMKDISDKSIDMILTDLPYGVTTRNHWDDVIPIEPLFKEFRRICKGNVVMTATNPFASKLINANPDYFRYDLVWNKKLSTGFLNANRQPLRIHENILVFYEKLGTYNPQRVKGEKPHRRGSKNTTETKNYGSYTPQECDNDLKYPISILDIQKVQSGKCVHPTEKPVELFEYLIRTYTNEGDIVLDCCAGSGTTAISCMNTKRNYICIEKDEGYFKIMQDRISSQTKPLEVFSK